MYNFIAQRMEIYLYFTQRAAKTQFIFENILDFITYVKFTKLQLKLQQEDKIKNINF